MVAAHLSGRAGWTWARAGGGGVLTGARCCLPALKAHAPALAMSATSLVWKLIPLAYPDESSSAGIFADLGLDLDNLVC